MTPRRILIAEDHALLLEGLRDLIATEFDCVGTVADGAALVDEALRLRPDIVLADVSLPLLNGIEAAARIRQCLPEIKIAILTMHADVTYLGEAFRIGASAYILKRASASELMKALRLVARGRTYIAPELAANFSEPRSRHTVESGSVTRLTGRQLEILDLVAAGKPDAEIGVALNIAATTVRHHRSTIEKKLGLSGAASLTRYVVTHSSTPHS